ncbi:MAG: translation initiation factor IF-3 [Methylacidiphilales bacterium]|nr:translation initiation factor IF-3 [Candidatus Methylacidiphilales bacterium]MDW8349724.1 translation initiation factor IF-3 [Verrucomicrobiae bacterium]
MSQAKKSSNSKHAVRVNQAIRAREVLVISQDGHSLGVMPIQAALQKAQAAGLDLIEISANANPPVCKILDYGKYRYEQSKKEKESKKHNTAAKLKELYIHMNIEPHDYEIKLRAAERFLWKGMKVKFNLPMRGRELIHKDLAEELMQRVREDMAHIGVTEAEPKLVGKSITMLLNPLPLQKRSRKYTTSDVAEETEENESNVNHSNTPTPSTPANPINSSNTNYA